MKEARNKIMTQYEMYELSTTGKKLTDNQVRINLDVAVMADEETKMVRAFYDGENENGEGVYKVRIYRKRPENTRYGQKKTNMAFR